MCNFLSIFRNYFNNFKPAQSQRYVQSHYDERQPVVHQPDVDFPWVAQVMQQNVLNYFCIVYTHIYRVKKVMPAKQFNVLPIGDLQCGSLNKVYVNVVPIQNNYHLLRLLIFIRLLYHSLSLYLLFNVYKCTLIPHQLGNSLLFLTIYKFLRFNLINIFIYSYYFSFTIKRNFFFLLLIY